MLVIKFILIAMAQVARSGRIMNQRRGRYAFESLAQRKMGIGVICFYATRIVFDRDCTRLHWELQTYS